MKKILALVLAMMVLAASMTIALAENVTITGPDNIGTHEYEVYQLFVGDIDGNTLTNVKYGTNHVNYVADTFVSQADLKTLTDIASETNQQAILDVVETLYQGNPVDTIKAGHTSASVAPGYYVIVDKAGTAAADAEDYSYSLSIVTLVKPLTISPKADTPEVTKKIDDKNDSETTADLNKQKIDSADYDIGDAVPYHLEGTLANNVDKYKKYHITFEDTLEAGKFSACSTPVITMDGAALADTEAYTVTTTYIETASENGFKVKIEFTPVSPNLTLPASLNSKVIKVDFNATLGEGANIGAEGNVNTVVLKYSNNPNNDEGGEEGTTPPDTVIAFTYKLVVNKVDQSGAELEGADFKLEKYIVETDSWVEVTRKTTNAVADDTDTPDVDESKGATTFTFTGLDDGIYKLTETQVPANFNGIKPITFKVTGTHTELVDPLDKTTKKDKNGAYVLTALTGTVETASENQDASFAATTEDGKITGLTTTITNASGIELPHTGGVGTTIFYIAGSILVLAAVIFLVTKRRMNANND